MKACDGLRLIMAVLGVLVASLATAGAQTLAITGATVVDATGPPRPDTTVLVEGERIVRVFPTGSESVPQDATVLDASGMWVIPGLIDAHVHFFQSGGLYTRPDIIDLRHLRPYEEELRRVRQGLDETLARYVASGVTGVVDMGGPFWTFEVRERARSMAWAPRVAVAGPLLGTMAPDELAGLADPPILHVETPAEARRHLRRILAREPDLIKLWFVSGANLEQDLAWADAAVAEAHAAGVPVVAHATRRLLARAVVDAGVDILAHGVDDRPMREALLRRMAERGVVYVTTLMVEEGYREVLSADVELSEIERRLGNPRVIASWSELPAPLRLAGPAVSRAEAENLRRAAAAGVTVAAGSDAGNIGTLHGPALHRELQLMVEAGLSPREVLTAATRGGAAAMGRTADLGTVEPGKLADLVILEADPLRDIGNTRRIHRVVKGGRVLDPADCCAVNRSSSGD